MAAQDNMKPLLLCTPFPHESHLNPILSVAAHLKKSGYDDVFMLTTPNLIPKAEELGVEGIEYPEPATEENFKNLMSTSAMPPGAYRHAKQFEYYFLDTLAKRTQAVEDALEQLAAKYPSRQIILMEDSASLTTVAFKYGRPLPPSLKEVPKSICMGIFPLLFESEDVSPWLSGIAPDSSEEGKKRNKRLHEESKTGHMKPYYDAWVPGLKGAGATAVPEHELYFQRFYSPYDAVMQLCSPSLEYYRSDMPLYIEYVGVIPPRNASAGFKYPSWWADIEAAKGAGKKIVLVTQGTNQIDPVDLIIPSIQGLADVEDLLVVATLGAKDAKLPEDFKVPPNARVIDYIPYDVILPFAEAFVFNAGYGGLTHAVRNGVPVVCAGETEDKPEVAMRAVFAGIGVDLKTMKPKPAQVKDAVLEILGEPSFKTKVMELKEENDKMDVFAAFERKMKELTI